MASLAQEIEKAEAAEKAAKERLRKAKAAQREAAKKRADRDALKVGRLLLAAVNGDTEAARRVVADVTVEPDPADDAEGGSLIRLEDDREVTACSPDDRRTAPGGAL